MVCAAKGYPLVVTMAESFSVERRKLMRFLGAKVVLTPAAARANGMVHKAEELAETNGWFHDPPVRERSQSRHPLAHHGAGNPRDFADEKLDYWVTGFGTGGTLKGVGRRPAQGEAGAPRSSSPSPKRADADQRSKPGAQAPTARRPAATPAWKPHPMQGWSPDFIPKITGEAVDREADRPGADRLPAPTRMKQPAAGAEGRHLRRHHRRRHLRRRAEGRREARRHGSTILCMLPDTGERYLSTPLFADVPADMTEEEEAISPSTPGQHLPPKPPPEAAAALRRRLRLRRFRPGRHRATSAGSAGRSPPVPARGRSSRRRGRPRRPP